MPDVDSQSERQRLAKVYGGLADEELLEIAEEEASLTGSAREALRSEMNKRNLSADAKADAKKDVEPKFVLLRRLMDSQEIALAKSILDAANVEYLISDEQTTAMSIWAPSFDGGGAKLFVKEQDAEFAGALLGQEQESV